MNSGQVTAQDPKGMSTHSVWLFSADKVTGPYQLVNGPLTPHYNNDATLFEDEDGQTHLYCSGNGLWQAKIDLPTGKLVGEIKQFRGAKDANNPGWMVGGIKGPFVLKREGTYFLFFSTWTHGYEVGLLRSDSGLLPPVLCCKSSCSIRAGCRQATWGHRKASARSTKMLSATHQYGAVRSFRNSKRRCWNNTYNHVGALLFLL